MALATEFVDLPLEELHRQAAIMKVEGWRFMQTHAVKADEGVDLYYSFMKDGLARNYKVAGVTKDQPVPSITDVFLAAFVFENEARELFGVDMRDIAIDFQGAMYAPAQQEPMTFITPEHKARIDAARNSDGKPKRKGRTTKFFVMTDERRARLDAKLAGMSSDKVNKVLAALKAREKEAAEAEAGGVDAQGEEPETNAAQGASAPDGAEAPDTGASATVAYEAPKADTVLLQKIAAMSPEKAAKVRAALSISDAPKQTAAQGEEAARKEDRVYARSDDTLLESKLAVMDASKAAKVREALSRVAARSTSEKGGE